MNESRKLTIVLAGYVPVSRNMLKGTHWSVLYQEKKRAAWNLWLALKSCSPSTLFDHVTMMDSISKNSRTCSSKLGYFMETHGIYSMGKFVPERPKRRRKKKLL